MEEKKFKHLRPFIWVGMYVQMYKGNTGTELVYDNYARGLGKDFDESVVIRVSPHPILNCLVVYLRE